MSTLSQRDGTKHGYVLAFNLYFDFSLPTLRAAGVPAGSAAALISAGDGSVTAYRRIRKGVAGQQPSGYVTKAHVVTRDNIDVDRGKENRFDPGNGYQDQYK